MKLCFLVLAQRELDDAVREKSDGLFSDRFRGSVGTEHRWRRF